MAITRTPGHVNYTGGDRPEVEVLVEDVWHLGELRSWDQDKEGEWSGMVEWRAGPRENRLDRFTAASIRLL